ncbi:hypothetical protein HMPREF3153_09740 [Corynebacterium sp. HMSC06C06]|uniref:Phage tail protein n=1 Tax=Corynebacterium striatum TaxID=43770 RepID=A0ABX7DDV9_CORST|nr:MULTISPECIES: hypothetical protein [Corynebacterium]OFT50498.1 hypothetical protein HMPREF3153_09740 [Corynebacterium sp. HMSC06C06]QQU76448.1 hypothetical protein I6I72_10080 [Corynebacterium striatum]
MAIKSYVVGPGTLTLSTPALDLAAQVTKCAVTPSVDREDPLHVLSGESRAGDSKYSATLDVTFLQDLSKSGIVDYSWQNAGKEVAFTYTPNTAEGAKVTGVITMDPVSIGGDVKSRATSDVSWQCTGLPKFAPKV